MTEPTPESVAQKVALQLGESCIHEPGPPKVDCPECCEKVLTDALILATQQGRREGLEEASLSLIQDNDPADNNVWAQAERHWHVVLHDRAKTQERDDPECCYCPNPVSKCICFKAQDGR